MINTFRLAKNTLIIVVVALLLIIIAVMWKENGILIARLQELSSQQVQKIPNGFSDDLSLPSPNRGFIQAAELSFGEGVDTALNPLKDEDLDNELLLLQEQLKYLVELKNDLEKK